MLIENLKKQQLLYTVAEKGAESTELKIIGSMKEALHPEIDGCGRYSQRDGASADGDCLLTVTEKGYCADAAEAVSWILNNPLIKHDLENRLRRSPRLVTSSKPCVCVVKKGLKAFTVMSCDNVRENGHVAKVAVLGLAPGTRSAAGGMD